MSRTGLAKGEGRPYLVAARVRDAMELELGQLDLRYGSLYAREKRDERQAVTAVGAERAGPVVVVREGERWVVVEGFATVRARDRLKHDTVEATVWETGPAQGLALRERLRRGRRPRISWRL